LPLLWNLAVIYLDAISMTLNDFAMIKNKYDDLSVTIVCIGSSSATVDGYKDVCELGDV
jgi:hypothetical protein